METVNSEIENFDFDVAVGHLKEAGSIATWKKEYKDEHKFWSKSEDFGDLKDKAGIVEASKGASAKKKAIVQPIKATISATNALALNEVLKDRGLKKFDISEVLDDALAQVPDDWWEQKQEELTPIEWKIQKIAQNPGLMSKLANQVDELLAGESADEVH